MQAKQRSATFNQVSTRLIAIGLFVSAAGCSSSTPIQTAEPSEQATPQQEIVIDGSSTVYPLTDEIVKEYQFEKENEPQITVNFSGTGGGFRKFCAGETDINNASRPILTAEMESCKANGVEYIELPVAYDALTVVVHPSNTWVDQITVEDLKKIWEPAAAGKITRWSQVNPAWPDRPINLYGAGGDSGTFDYFTEAVMGEAKASRSDYTASEDDEILVRGVRRDPDALGYFGYAYFEENQAMLKALAIDNGAGAIAPSADAVRAGQYQPLARPLFIYVNPASVQNKPALKALVSYYLAQAPFAAEVVGYVPLPDEAYSIALEHFNNSRLGSVFAGKSQTDLSIDELLTKEATY
jgi:phosphate transport system substrate-binding protein